MPKNTVPRRVSAPKQPQTKPEAKSASGIFDSDAGREAVASFEQQLWQFALQETELGKRARLAIRLKRDKPSSNEARRAIKPFMAAYVKLLMTPADKLESDAEGNLTYPVILPKTPRRKGSHA